MWSDNTPQNAAICISIYVHKNITPSNLSHAGHRINSSPDGSFHVDSKRHQCRRKFAAKIAMRALVLHVAFFGNSGGGILVGIARGREAVTGQLIRDILTTLPTLSVSQIQELHTAIHAMQAPQPSETPQCDLSIPLQMLESVDHEESGRTFTHVEGSAPVRIFHPVTLRRLALRHGKVGAIVAQTTAQDVASAVADTTAVHRDAGRSPAAARPDCETNSVSISPAPDHAPVTPDVRRLTERQQVVLALLLEGLPTKLIARRLGLTVNTVKEHISAILGRLGARTRAQLLSKTKPFRAGDTVPSVCSISDVHDQPVDAEQSGTTIEPKALGLTDRQGTVLLHLLDGLSNKVIARHLGLTENTVKEHVSAILWQLGASTRLQVISKFRQFGVAPQPPGPIDLMSAKRIQ